MDYPPRFSRPVSLVCIAVNNKDSKKVKVSRIYTKGSSHMHMTSAYLYVRMPTYITYRKDTVCKEHISFVRRQPLTKS